MPFYRKPRNFTPLHVLSERKAVKNGLHHAIFTSRFDRFVGDWKSDKKEGKYHRQIETLETYHRTEIVIKESLAWTGSRLDEKIVVGKGYFLTITGKLYEGDWYDGFRHGYGKLSYRQENGIFRLEYRGEWIRGKPDGIGWWWYTNGDIYFGHFKQGQRHGFGKMWYRDGSYYVGYWDTSLKGGIGMLVQVNGNRYEGHWAEGKKSGIGRYYHMHTGQLQEGCWMDDVCIRSKMTDIVIRQCCEYPTPYPIPQERLADSIMILEESELWLKQRIGEIDKNLKYCIDQIY